MLQKLIYKQRHVNASETKKLTFGARLLAICKSSLANRITRYASLEEDLHLSQQNATPKSQPLHSQSILWQKQSLLLFLPIFIFVTTVIAALSITANTETASAATANTLNFQGRLLTNTGARVPDGSYNIQFNLYTVASGGTTEWTETHTGQGGNPITVSNGYFSVYLGDATTGNPFPGTINWDQEHWLGMTVRGTSALCAFAACSPADAEMSPRFKLTAVPYAFRAGALVDSGGNAKTADQFAQLAPSSVQTANAAIAALRINQTGAGGLLQLQGNGTDSFTVDKTGNVAASGNATLGTASSAGTLTLRNSSGVGLTLQAAPTQAGGLTFSLPDTYGAANQCIKGDGAGGLSFGDCGSGGGSAAIGKTVVKAADETITSNGTLQNDNELFFPIGANETWTFSFVVQANSGTTADFRFGASAPAGATCIVGVSDYEGSVSQANLACGATTTVNIPGNGNATDDVFEVTGTVINGSTAGNVTLQWAQFASAAQNTTVRAGSYVFATSSGTSSTTFDQGGNDFGATAILGTTTAYGLNIIANGAVAQTISALGSVGITNDLTVGNGLTVSAGGVNLTGGINNNSGGITNAGAISDVSSIAGSSGLTIQSGGGGDLTLDSASNVLVLADDIIRRTASGTTTIDLLDGSGGTTLAITNSDGGQVAGLSVEGAVSASSFSGNGSGLTGLDGSAIASGTVGDAYLSSNVTLLNSNQTFSALKTFGAGLILGNSTSTTAGAMRWNGTDFEGYDGIQWLSLTSGGGGGGGASQAITVVKTANEVQNNVVNPTAALQDDDELFFPIAANESWSFRFTIQANANATPDIKFAVTAPTGATCVIGATEYETGTSNSNVGCGVNSGLVPGSSANEVYEVVGTITNGSTAGNVTLQWAQNTANAANVTVYAGSFVHATSGDTPVAGSEFVQGGNAFGSTGILGTTDAQNLNLIANNSTQLSLTTAGQAIFTGEILANGGVTVGNAASDSFTIVSDAVALTNGLNFDSNTFVIDSSTNMIGINNAAPANRLSINTPATADSLAEVLVSASVATNKGLVIQGTSSQSANLFEIQNDGGSVLAGIDSAGALILGNTSFSSGATVSRSISLPDASGTVCLSSSTSCGFLPYATGTYVTDGTTNDTIAINKTGASGNLIALQKSGGAVFTVSNTGSLQIQSTDTVALDIRNVGGTSYFAVDTSTGQVRIGPSTADGVGVLFTLDTKNTSGDPTGADGSMYYNSNTSKFRCYEGGNWKDCIGTRQVRSFIDTTADAAADNNTTNYWDTAVENNNSVPNISPSTTNKSVTGMVSFETASTTTADRSVIARVERSIGTPAACNSGTPVGTILSTFTTNNPESASNTMMFLDSPSTTSTVYYTLCADASTSSAANMTINRIRITLEEANNSN